MHRLLFFWALVVFGCRAMRIECSRFPASHCAENEYCLVETHPIDCDPRNDVCTYTGRARAVVSSDDAAVYVWITPLLQDGLSGVTVVVGSAYPQIYATDPNGGCFVFPRPCSERQTFVKINAKLTAGLPSTDVAIQTDACTTPHTNRDVTAKRELPLIEGCCSTKQPIPPKAAWPRRSSYPGGPSSTNTDNGDSSSSSTNNHNKPMSTPLFVAMLVSVVVASLLIVAIAAFATSTKNLSSLRDSASDWFKNLVSREQIV